MDRDALNALVRRIRAEFLEMPGLRLTPAQAGRLWGLDPAVCQDVIDTLVASAFLRWTANGMVVRATTGGLADPPPRQRRLDAIELLDMFVA